MMSKKEIVQGENEVVLHQNVARFKGVLNPLQSRSMLSILKRANEQVAENPEIINFTIPTDVFLEDIQNKDTAGLDTIVKKLNTHLKKLMVQLFEWGTVKEPECCIFMQQIKVTDTVVTLKFSDYIREHIKPISNVLIVKDFELIQSFRSEYARQLYKHLMMWEKRQTLYLTVKDFKDYLGVPATESYERMEVLKRKVLNVAVKEINEKCPYMDLQYSNRTLPRSKTIEGFNFGWRLKEKPENKYETEAYREDKEVTYNLPPDEVAIVGGFFGFLLPSLFYIEYADGSFDLLRENNKKVHCKSLKHFRWMFKNGVFAEFEKQWKKAQGQLAGTEIDKELMQYIGKSIYQNGYDWKIISISKNNNLYSIFCHEIDDKSYTKTFEISEVQLMASKSLSLSIS